MGQLDPGVVCYITPSPVGVRKWGNELQRQKQSNFGLAKCFMASLIVASGLVLGLSLLTLAIQKKNPKKQTNLFLDRLVLGLSLLTLAIQNY